MNILNKSITILLLSCFCVLSINMVFKTKKASVNELLGDPIVMDVTSVRPTSTGAKDASITITIRKGKGPFKVMAVSNTSLGTITKEGGNIIVLDQLYSGFYKLYIVDSEKNATEYQVTID